jgi:curved DNA-binding protein CbpA
MSQPLENYYQVLRVRKEASSTEIVAAYHAVKGALNQGANSGGLGLSAEDVATYLRRIEDAYSTLSDPKKRQDYDEIIKLAQPSFERESLKAPEPKSVTGHTLRQTREKLNLSREEIFRITRIPLRYLQAIEEEIIKDMPARVYLQGFVKNLAQVYKLNPQETARLFLEYFDKDLSQRAKP